MRLSIRYKILGVLGALLLAAVACYTVLASFIFTEQKTALLYDINHSIAVNAASQVRSSLLQAADQMRLFAVAELLSKKTGFRLPPQSLAQAFIQKAALFKRTGDTFVPAALPSDIPKLEVKTDDIHSFLETATQQQYAFSNGNQIPGFSKGAFYLATKLEISTGKTPDTYVVLGQLAGQLLFEPLQSATLFQSFLVNSAGENLLQIGKNSIEQPQALQGHPVLDQIKRSPASSGTQSFEFEKHRFLGAFAPVGVSDLWFISQADESEISSATVVLIQRSLLFGLIVATLTFIASILFSKRLTRNLNVLTQSAEQIGSGNWTGRIQIKSGDEVETLAASFNSMVDALRSSREAIEKYNRELEDKVALRTQQLQETNAAIKEVQEKLLTTSQMAAVGEVAGRTAHELLNPLTAILSRLERSLTVLKPATGTPAQLQEILGAWESDYKKGGFPQLTQALQARSTVKPDATLLEEDLQNLKELGSFWTQQSDSLFKDIHFVQDQAQRIHRIIDKMREYVRSSVKSDVHCHEAIDSAMNTMQDFLAKHSVKVVKDFRATADIANVNRDELIQIITNLIRNSFQSIQQAGVDSPGKISVVTIDKPGEIAVQVIDNGAGVKPGTESKLFEAGFTTKAPSEGTGLGLSICRRYAHAFGGEVEFVYSEPKGRGTCFQVRIPLQDSV
jgi:signal transduction histidine kinase